MRILALPVLLSLCAPWAVVSARADIVSDYLIIGRTVYSLTESAEAAGDGISVDAGTGAFVPSIPSGAVILTEAGGYDLVYYDTFTNEYHFKSYTGSIPARYNGVPRIPELKTAQDVSSAFGLSAGSIKVLSGASPLPPTWTIMLTGLVGLGIMLYRRRRPDGIEGMAVA